MKRHRKNRPNPSVAPCKPVDFTVYSEDGLGELGRFPREIRNMIYSYMVPSLTTHGPEDLAIDHRVVSKLVNAPIVATSKQVCVEFLEVFIREVPLEESDECSQYGECRQNLNDDQYDSDGNSLEEHKQSLHEECPGCLEKLLDFIKNRIEYNFHSNGRRLGLRVNTVYFQMDKYLQECREGQLEELPQKLQRLWDIHEDYRIPSDHIYLHIDYDDPGNYLGWAVPYNHPFDFLSYEFWDHSFGTISASILLSDEEASIRAYHDMKTDLKARITAYHTLKLREMLNISANEEEYSGMGKLLDRVRYSFYRGTPVQSMLKFHIAMAEIALEFWKAKEEQYSAWHLFELAESWLVAE